MKGSSTTQPDARSGPLLSGTPSIIGHFESVISNYRHSLDLAIEQVAQEEEDFIKQKARMSDSGWADLADQIKVQYARDSYGLDYSISTKNNTDAYKAQTLEFGDQMHPASPLLRTSAARSKETFDNRVSAKVNEILKGIK